MFNSLQYTEKLYDTDAYQTEFTASILSISPRSEKNSLSLYDVILNRTLFFPEEGGQNADQGTINGYPVTDVQIKDNIIIHTIAVDSTLLPAFEADLTIGKEIEGKIDWNMRYSNMQQHSGEHIISGLVHAHFGYNNVGFHLSPQTVTLDFNGLLDKDDLLLIETLANEAIYKNLTILAEYPDESILASLHYRSKLELKDSIRIVTIPGYDICACCAPHVKMTGEIGIIKITDVINYKGGVRISILCGNRALEDFRKKQDIVSSISILTSSKPEAITDAVLRLKEENYSLNGKIASLYDSLVELKAASIPPAEKNLCLFESALESSAHRKYVNLLVQNCNGICAVFVGNEENGYRYIIASKSMDVRSLNNILKEKFNAKGGGSLEMIQGSLYGNPIEITKIILSN